MKNQPADRPAYMAHCNHCGSCLNSCPLRLHDLKAEQGANVATNFQQTYIGHEMNARKGWSTSAHWKRNSAPKMNRGNTAESADGNQSDLGCNFVRRVHTDARSENQQRHTNKSLKPQTQDNQLLRCNPLPPAITGFLLLLLAYICVPQSVAADQLSPFNSNALYSPSTTPVGPSLCPLVPACQCKWSNGKQGKFTNFIAIIFHSLDTTFANLIHSYLHHLSQEHLAKSVNCQLFLANCHRILRY